MAILDVFKQKKGTARRTAAKAPASTLKEKATQASVTAPKKQAVQGEATDAYRVLMRPIVTEKATALNALNKYVFEVSMDATKNEVKKAIHGLYHVTPISVAMQVVIPKHKWQGRRPGKTVKWKKAIVTLKSGERISVYEGV